MKKNKYYFITGRFFETLFNVVVLNAALWRLAGISFFNLCYFLLVFRAKTCNSCSSQGWEVEDVPPELTEYFRSRNIMTFRISDGNRTKNPEFIMFLPECVLKLNGSSRFCSILHFHKLSEIWWKRRFSYAVKAFCLVTYNSSLADKWFHKKKKKKCYRGAWIRFAWELQNSYEPVWILRY